MSREGCWRATAAGTLAAVIALLAPAGAQAWQLTVQMHGGGKVDEVTPRDLMDCTSTSAVASAQYSGDCVAGTPSGVYSHGDIVEIQAVVPPAYAERGWRFSHWISNDGGGRVNCDGAEDGENRNFVNPCRFQIFGNLSMGAVFVDEGWPDTNAITGTPAEGSRTQTATGSFAYSSPDPTASLQCSWDNVSWSGCLAAPPLSEGSHTLHARAVDPSGHADASPSTRSFIIDRTPPNTSVTGSPPSLSNAKTANFTFSAAYAGGPSPEAFAGFSCQLDSEPSYTACNSGSQGYSNLGEGVHTFRVKAVDTAGNEDGSPDTYSWTVDSVAPDTAIAEGPPGSTESRTASFRFASEPTASFECSLDGAGFAACPATHSIVNLGAGTHTLQVRAMDAARNADSSPALWSWTVISLDADGDGSNRPADCNDANAAIHPGARDVPGNSVDEDCSGTPASRERVPATVSSSWLAFRRITRASKLRVKDVPAGGVVSLRCIGKGCSFKRKKVRLVKGGANLRKTVKQGFKPGSKLEVRITAPEMIGKVVRYSFRKGRPPTTRTLCLPLGAAKPVRC